jgi:hypothetical protein
MAEVNHKIRAYLYENPFTEDPNDYMARVISERSLTIRDICDMAVARGGADVAAASIEHSVNLFLKEMGYQLCNGYSVNTGYFIAGVHLKGVFNDPDEQFNPLKHILSFDFHQGDLLHKELQTIDVVIQGVADVSLSISQVTDVRTSSVNDLLTPNYNLKISGYKLKIAGDDPTVGVYFIAENNDRIKVDTEDVVINNPSELLIRIPDLRSGSYKLEVVTQFAGSSILLKQVRSTEFNKTLTVQ